MNIAEELLSKFYRPHQSPRICRSVRRHWGAREKHYYASSYRRYLLTDDGKKVVKGTKRGATGITSGDLITIRYIEAQKLHTTLIQRVTR